MSKKNKKKKGGKKRKKEGAVVGKGSGKKGKKKPKKTIMQYVMGLFEANPQIETTRIIDKVLNRWPDSKINKQHVGWYRSKARSLGILAPVSRKKKKKADEGE